MFCHFFEENDSAQYFSLINVSNVKCTPIPSPILIPLPKKHHLALTALPTFLSHIMYLMRELKENVFFHLQVKKTAFLTMKANCIGVIQGPMLRWHWLVNTVPNRIFIQITKHVNIQFPKILKLITTKLNKVNKLIQIKCSMQLIQTQIIKQ